MEIKEKVQETANPMLSPQEIVELCSVFKDVVNNHIMLINNIAPMVTYSGLMKKEEETGEEQEAINQGGLTLAREHQEFPTLKIGDRVALALHTQPAFSKVITMDEFVHNLSPTVQQQIKDKVGRFANLDKKNMSKYYRKFLILLIHPTNLVAIYK